MPRPAVEPVRVRERDDELGCDRLRLVGFRGYCGKHWRGPTRKTIAEAYDDAIAHNRSERQP